MLRLKAAPSLFRTTRKILLFENVGVSLALESVLISLSNEKDDAGRKLLTSRLREYITQPTCVRGVLCRYRFVVWHDRLAMV